MKICPNCQIEFDDSLMLCDQCGSKLLALTKQTYKKLNGTDIKVVAPHVGLECGTFAIIGS